jgi:hypothetical protein
MKELISTWTYEINDDGTLDTPLGEPKKKSS